MFSATRPRITVAIGVLALILAAIAPATTWAAEPPAKQDKKTSKPTGTAQVHLPQKPLRKNSPRRRLREKLHPVSVRHQRSTSSHLTKGKRETR